MDTAAATTRIQQQQQQQQQQHTYWQCKPIYTSKSKKKR